MLCWAGPTPPPIPGWLQTGPTETRAPSQPLHSSSGVKTVAAASLRKSNRLSTSLTYVLKLLQQTFHVAMVIRCMARLEWGGSDLTCEATS